MWDSTKKLSRTPMNALPVFIALILCSSFASAETDVTIYGDVTMSKPLQLQKCPEKYYMQNHPSCFMGGGDKSVFFVFGSGSQPPSYLKDEPSIDLRNGVVVGMTIGTNGVIGQEAAYSDLVKKFGAPTKKSMDAIKTVGGASHTSIVASWRLDNLSVSFNGVIGSVSDGIIVIQTPELETERMNRPRPKEM